MRGRTAFACAVAVLALAQPLAAQDTTADEPERDKVEAQVLPDIDGSALGLLPSRATGLPTDLWADTAAARIVRQIANVRGTGTPAARQLFEILLLAEAIPPAEDSGSVLVARIEALLRLGSLDAAEAMLARAPVDLKDRRILHLALDVAALTNRSGPACARLASQPGLSPGMAYVIWCRARHGEWPVARITLDGARALGSFDQVMLDHLEWFLDSEAFEPTTDFPFPDPMTPLAFALRESTGQTRPPEEVPLAWLDGDLTGNRTLRARIEAAEALARGGTLSASVLFAAYRAGTPAASGSLWSRAEATQVLDRALLGNDPVAVLDALHALDAELAPLGLRPAAAREYGAALGAIPVGEADDLMAQYLLLDGRGAGARAWMPDPAPYADRVAYAVQSTPPMPMEEERTRTDQDQRAAAIHAAFSDPADAPILPGNTGLVLLSALRVLDAGTQVEPDDLRRALVNLRRAGQERLARRIAVQTLFMGDRG